MLHVVLDTSVIAERDWHLATPAARALLAAAGRVELSLIVPEVVVREAARKYTAKEEKLRSELEKTSKELMQLTSAVPGAEAGRLAAPYATAGGHAERLRERVRAAGGMVAGIPAADHSELLDRALAGRKPFTPDGKVGYRDALIWETFLAEIAGADSVLVTNDNDFLDPKNRGQLHPDLLTDLERRGLGAADVRVANSLHAAVELVIAPAEALTLELRSRLREEPEFRDELLERLRQVPPYGADDRDVVIEGFHTDDEAWIGEVTSSTLSDLVEFSDPVVMSVYQAREGEYVVELAVSAIAAYDVDATIDWPRTWPERGFPVSIMLSRDERSGSTTGHADVVAVFDAIYRPGDGQFADIQARILRPN